MSALDNIHEAWSGSEETPLPKVKNFVDMKHKYTKHGRAKRLKRLQELYDEGFELLTTTTIDVGDYDPEEILDTLIRRL